MKNKKSDTSDCKFWHLHKFLETSWTIASNSKTRMKNFDIELQKGSVPIMEETHYAGPAMSQNHSTENR